MARAVEAGLQALIDSGHCRWYETIDLLLADAEEPLHLSTGEIVVGDTDYHAQLVEVEPLSMSLDQQMDEVKFQVENQDLVMGQALTGQVNLLTGATAMLGIVFENEDNPAERYYDPKMPGFVVTGEVDQDQVSFSLISEVDGVIIPGRTVVSVFPWREPIHMTPLTDPNDLLGPGGVPGPGQIGYLGDGTIIFNPGGGRYPILDLPVDLRT